MQLSGTPAASRRGGFCCEEDWHHRGKKSPWPTGGAPRFLLAAAPMNNVWRVFTRFFNNVCALVLHCPPEDLGLSTVS
ncbi:hypothetical protein E2C01_072044 [Portunus trituberculatus]|uniref:Uncharacterized protein n=1 Tax=Portunus trituberculatus TaxID=210409 RepID=A0A5B7I7W3_PORTR|nr:hypothetical protein [Portunus trituberculatus]